MSEQDNAVRQLKELKIELADSFSRVISKMNDRDKLTELAAIVKHLELSL